MRETCQIYVPFTGTLEKAELCGKPAVDFAVYNDIVGEKNGELEFNDNQHKLWMCAEHFDTLARKLREVETS